MGTQLKTEISKLIDIGIEEDAVERDYTTLACTGENLAATAEVVLQEKAKVAGLIFIPWIFEKVDPSMKITTFVEEGEDCEEGTVLFRLEGKARALLSIERLLLNILQHTSAIATKTAKFVKEVEGYGCEILDTRKTLPGLRILQKYAVQVGGGKNHRFNLSDLVLIKDNHLAMLESGGCFGVSAAIQKVRSLNEKTPIEVEVENLEMLKEALDAKPDRILLDNMEIPMLQEAVALSKGKAYLEASGGITLETVRSYASTGVNGISVGALTHSITVVNMSMSMQVCSRSSCG